MELLENIIDQPFEKHPANRELWGAPVPGSLYEHSEGWDYWRIVSVERVVFGVHEGVFVMIEDAQGNCAQGIGAGDDSKHDVLLATIDALDIAGQLADAGGYTPPAWSFDGLADLVAGVSV